MPAKVGFCISNIFLGIPFLIYKFGGCCNEDAVQTLDDVNEQKNKRKNQDSKSV